MCSTHRGTSKFRHGWFPWSSVHTSIHYVILSFFSHASGISLGLSVGWSTTLVQTEIFQHLLDGLAQNVVRRIHLNNFGSSCSATSRSKFWLFLWNSSTSPGWDDTKFDKDIHGSQRMNPNDFIDPLTFPVAPLLGWHFWLSTGWISIKVCAHIRVPFGMKCNDFGDPLIFHVAPLWDQNFILPSTLIYDQIPEKLMQFQSASAVLCV